MLASSIVLLLGAPATPLPSPPATATVPPSVLVRQHHPRCPAEVHSCFGLDVHVVTVAEEPVASVAWLDSQVAVANRHFAAIDVGFELASVTAAPETYAHIATREQRDKIGLEPTHARHAGLIPLFVVSRLEDVDAPGEQIRGVHWRRRQNIEQRWLIVSTIASPMVLAHELGHYFGLPHSTYAVSIMNKRARKRPPRDQRTFAAPEIERLRRGRDAAISTGHLTRRKHRP